jgi:hypothetical protein
VREHPDETTRREAREQEQDAERYRFLRKPGNVIVYAKVPSPGWGNDGHAHVRYDTPEQLDAAIDGAITASQSDAAVAKP